MGGCATKPKALESHPEELPTEKPSSPKKAEGENVPQENSNGSETKKEEPLVDISEPAQEAPQSEESSKTAEAEVVPEEGKPTEDKDEAANKPNKTTEEKKEEVADVTAEKPEAEVAAPESDDKSDAPLVTV